MIDTNKVKIVYQIIELKQYRCTPWNFKIYFSENWFKSSDVVLTNLAATVHRAAPVKQI